MMRNTWSRIAFASLLALPLVFASWVATGQTAGSETVRGTMAKQSAGMSPDAGKLAGLRVSNNDQKILGVVNRVVKHGDQDYALVTVGEFTKKEPGSLIAIPVAGMWVDGQQVKYDIAWDRYKELPAYDGKTPTWMKEKN